MTGFEPWTSGVEKQPLYQLSHNHCSSKVDFVEVMSNKNFLSEGSGCNLVGRAVASDT